MSDFRGIGGVSATLRTLLSDRMELPDGLTKVSVTVGPPPFAAEDTSIRKEDPRINLFLYRVTENGHLQNQEIPGRGSAGAYGHPPLNVNLHYLLTAYGLKEIPNTKLFDDTQSQFLLGSAMRVLHDVPIVTDKLSTVSPTSGLAVLHESLRRQFEQVRLSLEPLSLEDTTKIWTALALRYRLSAAYVVNVVQIESGRPRRFPRPVGQPPSEHAPLPGSAPAPGPWVYVLTLQTPTITAVNVRRAGESTEQPYSYARVGDTLVLRGTSLSGPVTKVQLGDLRVPADAAHGDAVEVTLPDVLQLQPGVRTVKVVVSDPAAPGSAFSSNDAAFVLVPRVSSVVATTGPPRRLTIAGTRLADESATGETIIGTSVVDRGGYLTALPAQLVVPIPDTLPAREVRVVVSGALPDPVVLSGDDADLDVTIGVTAAKATLTLPDGQVGRAALPRLLATAIHDANPADAAFTGLRATLVEDRLVVVAGGLREAPAFASPTPPGLAEDVRLIAAQVTVATNGVLSGPLLEPLVLTAHVPRLELTIGLGAPVTLTLATADSLAELAAGLQTAIRGASGAAAYAGARVAVLGAQLLVIPGASGAVEFAGAPGDDTTIAELRLRARFAVRVRVDGAESIDGTTVELPQ